MSASLVVFFQSAYGLSGAAGAAEAAAGSGLDLGLDDATPGMTSAIAMARAAQAWNRDDMNDLRVGRRVKTAVVAKEGSQPPVRPKRMQTGAGVQRTGDREVPSWSGPGGTPGRVHQARARCRALRRTLIRRRSRTSWKFGFVDMPASVRRPGRRGGS